MRATRSISARAGFAGRRCRPARRLGTASLRRQAQARRLRPDLAGHPATRKCRNAARAKSSAAKSARPCSPYAGLKRLGLAPPARRVLDVEAFSARRWSGRHRASPRAPETRATLLALAPILDPVDVRSRSPAERAFSLRSTAPAARPSPATRGFPRGALTFRGLVLRPDGSEGVRGGSPAGATADSAALGDEAGARCSPGCRKMCGRNAARRRPCARGRKGPGARQPVAAARRLAKIVSRDVGARGSGAGGARAAIRRKTISAPRSPRSSFSRLARRAEAPAK